MSVVARVSAVLAMAGVLVAAPVSAQSQTVAPDFDEAVFFMGGPFTESHFSDAFFVWNDHYESNFFLGGGYQRFFHNYQSFQFGVEAGLGLRLGEGGSAEAWTGLVARLTELEIGDFNITPAVTGGFSVVTDTIGVETTRTARAGQSATLLYYMGPEIAISHDAQPQWEAFGRLQHRSGGFGTIAHIDGSNAVTLGIRYKF